jgi:hypothetical protein
VSKSLTGRSPGRPPLGSAARSKVLQILVTPEQKTMIERLASASPERTASNWGYQALLERLDRVQRGPGEQPPGGGAGGGGKDPRRKNA